MGFTISWIGFKNKTVEQVADLLSLVQSGRLEQEPASLFSGLRSNTGWYVVFINEFAHRFVSARSLQRVSQRSEVVAANVEEHVMFSSAEAWTSGRQVWKVTHEGESGALGPRHLEEQGEHPDQYIAIKQRLLAEQQREDQGERQVDFVFDIPLELAKAVVGFRHDKIVEERFEVLRPVASRPGLLARLFGET